MKKLVTLALLSTLAFPVVTYANTGTSPTPALEQGLGKLPTEEAETFRDHLQQAHEDNKDLYEQVHQLHEDMHNILRADNFDQDAFSQKTKQLRDAQDQIAENLDKAFVEAMAELPKNDRIKLADSLARAHKQEHAMKKAEKATEQQ